MENNKRMFIEILFVEYQDVNQNVVTMRMTNVVHNM